MYNKKYWIVWCLFCWFVCLDFDGFVIGMLIGVNDEVVFISGKRFCFGFFWFGRKDV